MKVTGISIIVGALGTFPKGFEKSLEELEIRQRIGIIQTTALLRLAIILRRILETWEDFLSFRLPRKNHQLMQVLRTCNNIKVTVIPVVIGALGRVTKWLVRGLEDLKIRGWVETIQTTALLRSVRIIIRVIENWGDLLSLRLLWKTIS